MKSNYLKLLLITLFFASCKKEQAAIPIKEFFVNIRPEKLSRKQYKTEITTNFPESTPFTITVSRDYQRINNPEKYAGELYYSFDSRVKNGKINFNFNTDDSKWVNEYNELKKKYSNSDKSFTDIDMSTISDSVEISVLFTPKAEINDEIKNVVGISGEKLKGKEVSKISDFYTYEKKIRIFNRKE